MSANRPKPPWELYGEALSEWNRVCGELDAGGLLDQADRAILVLYCQTWQIYRAAMQTVQTDGATMKHTNGVEGPHPAYKIAKETGAHLQKLLADLGLTPAARNRRKIAPKDERSELDEF